MRTDNNAVANKSVCALLISALLVGCASMTPEQFNANRYTLSDTRVCRVWLEGSAQTLVDSHAEAMRRGLTRERCDALIRRENVIAGVAAVAAVALVVAASKSSGGGGYGGGSAAQQDFDWDWDQFYDERRQLVWACRGVQTGQFADLSRCAYKPKLDSRWPLK